MTWTLFEPAFPETSGCRPAPYTARPPGLAHHTHTHTYTHTHTHIYIYTSYLHRPSGSRLPVWKSSITLSHAILGRTPLDEWLARHRNLYRTTHNTHKRQTSITVAGFEPKIPASKRPQTHALDCFGHCCCIVMPAWTILLFYFNNFYWCILPFVYCCSCNSRPQVAGHGNSSKNSVTRCWCSLL